jgi:hypothetical protein
LEAREKAATSSQLEASRDGDDAQRVHPELDCAQKIYDRQRVPFEAGAMPRPSYESGTRELENAAQQWAAVNKAARATADRIQNALKERESAKKIGDASQQLATAAALQQAVVAPVAGVVVGRKGEADQPEHEPGDEPFGIATDAFDFEIPVEPTPEVLKRLLPGQAVLVIVSDVPNSRYAGTVNGIAKN